MANELKLSLYKSQIRENQIRENQIRENQIRTKQTITNLIMQQINIPYPLKQNYNVVIPLNIFQTWHTKNLPPLMRRAVNSIKSLNPRFKYALYDDNDCREFIKSNFSLDVLNAYDGLVPGAYKADLWRYCILYKKGGIYLDIKYAPYNGFRFITLTEKEHFVLDADNNGIYNALIVSKPNNELLLKAIKKIVENVKKKHYGSNCLEPTGPQMLNVFFSKEAKNNLDMKHKWYLSFNNRFILFNNFHVLKSYNGYLSESSTFEKTQYYGTLWDKRQIYK